MPFVSTAQVGTCFQKLLQAQRKGQQSKWNCEQWLRETSNPAALHHYAVESKERERGRLPELPESERRISPVFTGPRGGKFVLMGNLRVSVPVGYEKEAVQMFGEATQRDIDRLHEINRQLERQGLQSIALQEAMDQNGSYVSTPKSMLLLNNTKRAKATTTSSRHAAPPPPTTPTTRRGSYRSRRSRSVSPISPPRGRGRPSRSREREEREGEEQRNRRLRISSESPSSGRSSTSSSDDESYSYQRTRTGLHRNARLNERLH